MNTAAIFDLNHPPKFHVSALRQEKQVKIVYLKVKLPVSKLVINTKYEVMTVSFDDILYCEAQNNYTMIYYGEGKKVLCSKTLKIIAESLKHGPFLRIHKSYLVRKSEIRILNKSTHEIFLGNQIFLPVSRSRRKEVLILLNAL
ncbi:MAG: LytTR family DNA-binding domain-containing protein [Saprospiraceae bacterium]